MKTPEELQAAASRYRMLAQSVTDKQAIKALLELADEFEKRAIQDERIHQHNGIEVDGDD